MSMFFNQFSNQELDPEKIKLAEIQFSAMNTTFNTILKSCLEKCISHEGYSEAELNKGEMTCIDRCVAKMHFSNRLIGGFVQTKGFTPERYLEHYRRFKEEDA
ncbi:hypothetical protein TPHA_0A03730 [Tetrapisispora phaffii CBS 4417]|uniref:Mitochondrial import inner membrane translocase subunit n=1 Tax=Tetrapisispora phaffii (strain ATCC 24235 / CBS 4417 / NBRC 1672 / NRRL Y-8282 / UCD 70-5) TaxID=1071381 RepID=G8BNH1_TETPH|nr:hypothetical protein TPHA_0A03730 [Tetrapisispora phaffii CBS 4417]CCE61449.1 hypothetical protein TPHA_0A03730 [Tetrapisispora phaffii CBS 4417]